MDASPETSPPGLLRHILGFLLVSAAWGLTTPFMRLAALRTSSSPPPSRLWLNRSSTPFLKSKIWTAIYGIQDVLSNPMYAALLVLNLTGSVWFFLLVGQSELSLTVPITNSLAFLFTVLGEWMAEGKVISKDTWLGMGLVLGGIALCVHSKTM